MPAVSIIIPVYNTEAYLHRCLDSLLAQTYTDFEILCVDDGSTDNSGRICDEYACKDKRIRVVHIPNGGVSNARNTGLDLARGEYILFVDSDDWVEPEHIEFLLPVAGEDLVYCGVNTVIDGKEASACAFQNRRFDRSQWEKEFGVFWREFAVLAIWRGCYKRGIICKNGLCFDKEMTIGEDEHFNLQYIGRCRSIRFSDASTYNYEVGDHSSAMHRYHPNRTEDCVKICQTIEDISQKKRICQPVVLLAYRLGTF